MLRISSTPTISAPQNFSALKHSSHHFGGDLLQHRLLGTQRLDHRNVLRNRSFENDRIVERN
jgi:hypothetical protein